MPTYSPADQSPPFAAEYGNRTVHVGKVTIASALLINDRVRLCKIPAGTRVDRVVINNGDLDTGTTMTDRVGFEFADGVAVAGITDQSVQATGGTVRRAPATTTTELWPPIVLPKEAWLVLVVDAAPTGQSGSVDIYGKVEGESVGPK